MNETERGGGREGEREREREREQIEKVRKSSFRHALYILKPPLVTDWVIRNPPKQRRK